MKSKFKHDCTGCNYIGQAMYRGEECDFYICTSTFNNDRTIIARYGSDGPEYSSYTFLGGMDLSPLDWFVLSRGIELTDEDKNKLIKVLLAARKDKLGMQGFREHGLFVPTDEEEQMFGKENWMGWWKNESN